MFIAGYGKWPPNTPKTVTLNRGQVFSAVPYEDMSANLPLNISKSETRRLAGTRVTSTQPVAVHTTDDLLYAVGGVDFVADQHVPNAILGSDYIVMRGQDPTDTPDVGEETAYILATEDATEIYVDGMLDTTINAGQQHTYEISNKATRIHTNDPDKPITILHVSGVPDQVGGAILPPIDNDKCTGSFNVVVNRSDNMTFNLMVLVRKGGEGGFTVNGDATIIQASDFTNVPGTDWSSAFIPWDAPINTPLNVLNSINMFHLGTLMGDENEDCFYGYFSDFNSNRGEAVSVATDGNIDADHCLGDTIQLRSNGGKSYLWTCATDNSFNDPTLSSPSIKPVSGLHKYDVAIERTCYLDTTMTIWVKIDSVNSYFEVGHPTPDCCSPVISNFNNKSFGDLDFYYWDFSDGDVLTIPTPPEKTSINTSGSVDTLIVGLTVGKNCFSYYEDTIFVSPQITAKGSKGTKSGCQQQVLQPFLIDTTNNSHLSYIYWDWGDGNDSIVYNDELSNHITGDPNEFAFTHIYTNLSNFDTAYYPILVFVDTLNNCRDTLKPPLDSVLVPGVAHARYTISNTKGCSPLNVTISNHTNGIVAYKWWFYNGNAGPEDAITNFTDTTIIYTNNTLTTPDTNYIFLEITKYNIDGSTCIDTYGPDTIIVYPEFTSIITADKTFGCNPLDVDFSQTISPNVQNLIYNWNFGDGSSSGLANPPNKTYSHIQPTQQDYIATLTTTSEYNCTSTAVPVDIHVYSFINAHFTVAPDTSGCSPFNVEITNNTSPNADVQIETWTNDGGVFIPVTDTFTLNYTNLLNTDEQHEIILTNSNGFPACDTSFSKTVVVHPEITAEFSDNSADTICNNTLVTFSNESFFTGVPASLITSATPTVIFLYEFGDNTTSALENPTKIYTNNTSVVKTYNTKLTLTVNGCSSIFNGTIIIFPEITAQMNTAETFICAPDVVTISNTSVCDINTTSFVWDFSDGSTTQNTTDLSSITYNISNNLDINDTTHRHVYLTATNTNCTSKSTITFVVYPTIVPHIEPDIIEGCGPLTVNLTNQTVGENSDNPLTYKWDFGDNTNSTLTDVIVPHTFGNKSSSDTPYAVTLEAKNNNGCTATHDTIITVFPEIKADFTFLKFSDCSPITVLMEYSTLNGTSFEWDFGFDNNKLVAPNNNSFSYGFYHTNTDLNTPDIYNIELIVVDTNHQQCNKTVTHPIKIFPPVVANFNISDSIGCSPLTAIFADSSTGYKLSYVWDYNDGSGSVSSLNPHNHIFNNLVESDQTYNIKMVATDTNGCQNSTNQNATAYSYINPSFGIIHASSKGSKADQLLGGCTPFDIELTDSSTCNGTWTWDFGDGTSDVNNSQPPTKDLTYTNSDNTEPLENEEYTITLIVENTQGCTKTTSQTLEVYPRSIPKFNVNNIEGCHPLVVEFENTTIDDSSSQYYWVLGDGATSVNEDLTHTYYNNSFTDIKSFNVNMFCTTSNLCTDSTSGHILVYPTPLAAINPILDRECSPFTASLENVSQGAQPYTFYWDYDNEIPPFTKTSLTTENPSYTNLGTDVDIKYVELIIASNNNCRDTVVQIINVYPEATAEFTMSDTNGCSPLNVEFTNESTVTATSYTWDFDNGATSQLKDPTNRFINDLIDDQVYTISLDVETTFGCKGSVQHDIEVYLSPNAEFIVTEPIQKYPNTVFEFVNKVKPGPWTFVWDYGDGQSSNNSNTTHTYDYVDWGPKDNDFTYTAWLKAHSDHCVDSVWQLVTIDPAEPFISIVERNPVGCSPKEVNFDVDYKYGDEGSIKWNFGYDEDVSTEISPTYTYNEAGIYIATVTISGDGGTQVDTTRIVVYPLPEPNFEYSPDFVMLPDQPVQFFNTTYMADDQTYLWTFGDGTSSTEQQPWHQYTYEGIFDVKMVATTAHNCIDSIIIPNAVEVNGEGYIDFPNAFLPTAASPSDGSYPSPDSENSVFHPKHDGVKDYELWIFNRWGEQLFYSSNVDVGWNGRYGNNGDDLGQDVYFWKTKGSFNNNVPFKKAGDVTLIRR